MCKKKRRNNEKSFIYKKIVYTSLFFSLSMLFFFIQTSTPVEAANESKITFSLWGNSNGSNTGALVLDVPNVLGNEIKLSYSGKSGVVFHDRYPNTKYLEVKIIRNGTTIFTASANGDTQQNVFIDKIKNISVKKGDILHFYFREPSKQRLVNLSGGQTSLGEYVAPYFKNDMYYMITQDGFIPVNTAISVTNFDLAGIYNYTSTLFYKHILGYSETMASGFKQANPTIKFHFYLPEHERFALSRHEVAVDHTLTVPKKKLSAYGKTTFGEMNDLVKEMQVNNGNIYQVYFPDPEKVGIWRNGVRNPLKDLTQRISYFELTEQNGLVELDFYKVKAKELTLELGSDPKKVTVPDITTISDYPTISSSLKSDIKTDKLGAYDQSVIIKQPLETNTNYLQSEITSKIMVVDTTKPTAMGKKAVEIPIYEPLPANPTDLLENIQDNSDVNTLKIEYLDENGDTSIPGIKQVKIRLTDASGNYSDISVAITIVPGSLTIASVPNLNFGQIKTGTSTKNLNQTVSEITIDDFRGTKVGWTLQASMSDFSTQDGKKLNSDLSLINGVLSSSDQKLAGVSMYNVTLNNFPQNIIRAEKNSGVKKWVGTFKKDNVFLENISPDARIGSYESVINWTLLDAP